MSINCGKGFLYFYNLIMLAISGALMYLAVLFISKWGDYSLIAANTYSIVPVGIIFVFGIIIFITSIVGLCGTCNESSCTLGVFFSLLFVILTIEIVGGSLTYIKKAEIESKFEGNLWDAFERYYDEHSATRNPIDKMQRHLQCCGVTGPMNWENVTHHVIPESCCIHRKMYCYQLPDNVYSEGCYNKLIDMFSGNLSYIMGVLIGFAVFQLMGMMLSVYLMAVMRKRQGYLRILDNQTKT